MGTEHKIDMADLCELAHELTADECERKGIELDMKVDENGDETERYSDKAQDIFNDTLDRVENILTGDSTQNRVCKKVKLSSEAYEMVMELLESEYNLQIGHEDRQEYVGTVMEEIKSIGFIGDRLE